METAEGKKNLHAGHRERVKQRFRKEGLDGFEDHEVLELLLYYGIPQKDVNAIAHQLLDRYGSFGQVFAADYEQLLETPGMTASAALLLKIVPQLSRRYVEAVAESVDVLDSSEKIGKFLIPKFLGRTDEVVYLLCLNNACRLLRCDLLSEGTLNGAQVDVRRLVEIAFQCKAINVVLAHNHPHGLSRPSSQEAFLRSSSSGSKSSNRHPRIRQNRCAGVASAGIVLAGPFRLSSSNLRENS